MQAVERGAVAVVAARDIADLPGGTEVLMMPDVPEALSRLAVAFYNAPSEKMTVIGVIGAFHAWGCCQLVAAKHMDGVEVWQAQVVRKLLGHMQLVACERLGHLQQTPSASHHVPAACQAVLRPTVATQRKHKPLPSRGQALKTLRP